MRMWMIDPSKMCRKHLLGEHVEIHMLVGSILKKKNLGKFLEYRLIEPKSIVERHRQLVDEMTKRGYKHKSELPEFNLEQYDSSILSISVDVNKSIHDISERCSECNAFI